MTTKSTSTVNQTIEKYRNSFVEYITLSGNQSLKKNRENIIIAYDMVSEVLKLTRNNNNKLLIQQAQELTEILIEELNLGTKSVIAALFFISDKYSSFELDEIKHLFGERVAEIVNSLIKFPQTISNNPSNKAEHIRNLLLTISIDARVIFITLAYKLLEIRHLSKEKSTLLSKNFAAEILEIYAPIAHRIGLYNVKTELEDLSFKLFQPDIYKYISDKLDGTSKKRINAINKFTIPIMEALDKLNISYEIDGRVKSIYSIWNKMQKKHVTFDEIYDIYAIRIIFEANDKLPESSQCWNIFSIITQIYPAKMDRLRDWISNPKDNGYEALHITLKSTDQKWIEVQIRSKRMDDLANLGIAAHWKYKGFNTAETAFDKLIQELHELKKLENENPYELLDNFKSKILYPDIYVFTPKNEIVKLKMNATVLDFAFHIHTEVGYKCIGAKVNYKTVPPEYVLSSGDKVEILTSEKQSLKKEWVNLVKTEKAKEYLKRAFRQERKSIIRKGFKSIENLTNQENIYFDNYIFRKLARSFGPLTKEQLYYKVGNNEISTQQILKILQERSKVKKITFWKIIPNQALDNFNYKIELAKCCVPLPGTEIIGIKTNQEIIAHKSNCELANSMLEMHLNRKFKIKWLRFKEEASLEVINFQGIDHSGIVNRVSTAIANEININMRSIHFESDQRNFKGKVEIYVPKNYQINNFLFNLTQIKGMKKVEKEN